MEETHAHSLFICQQIIENTIVSRAGKMLPPSREKVGEFSSTQASTLAQKLIQSADYFHDNPTQKLNQDKQIRIVVKRHSKVTQTAPVVLRKKASKFSTRSSKGSTSQIDEPHYTRSPLACGTNNEMNLVPLAESDGESHNGEDQDDLQTRLRERKIHQQYYRTKYEQNMRFGGNKKKVAYNGKGEGGKGAHSVVAYDFDGTIIENNNSKNEAVKMPLHFLDLDVSVNQKEEEHQREPRRKGIKLKSSAKKVQLPGMKRQEIKIQQSSFLKDFSNLKLTEGVQLRQSKEECRKILGYNGSAPIIKKKKIDLFKTESNGPVRLRLQELMSYKNLVSANSQMYLSREQIERQSQHFVAQREESKVFCGESSHKFRSKFIKVTNNRALQFLLGDESDDSRKPALQPSKKGMVKSVHICV